MGDPFSALAKIIVGYHDAGIIQGWLRLLFSMSASFFITFSIVAGGAWASGTTATRGAGLGLVMAGAMAFRAYLAAPKAIVKGTVLVVPQETVEDANNKATGQGPLTVQPK